jgi:hypothetical protein
MGELAALADKEEPVWAQTVQPDLSAPYEISLQDQKNQIVAQGRAAQKMAGNNPAAQAIIAAQMYDALKLLYMKPMAEENSDEFKYLEKTFGRPPIEVHSWDNATGIMELAGTYTASTDMPVVVGDVLYATTGEPLIVSAVTHSAVADSATITLAAQTGESLGATMFTAGDVVAIQGAIIADGMDKFLHYDRLQTVTRYNFIQLFQRANRWSTVELQKLINNGTTNYKTLETQEKINQMRNDLFSAYFNGTRGEFSIPGEGGSSWKAKCMGGIYPTMVAAGSGHATVALSGLKTAFEELAFDTNYKKEGSRRFVYGTDKMLYELSRAYKENGSRYTPSDNRANLNLKMIEVGSQEYVLVPCELFREDSVLPSSWQTKLLVLDQESITPIKMKGLPHIEVGQTDNKNGGSYRDYTDWWVKAMLSMRFNNPLGSFYIDVTL